MANTDPIDYQLQRYQSKPKLCEYFEDENTLQSVYTLINVTPELADQHLRVFCEEPEDNLILIHYLTPHEKINHIRGIIIDTKKMAIVCMSFPYTDDLTVDKVDAIEGAISDYSVTRAHEGTILRYFKGPYTDKWYLSTHRKINCRESRWSGPTFGEMFDNFWLEPENLHFDPHNLCYVFLLSHVENRLVCKVDKTTLYYLGTFNGKECHDVDTDGFIDRIKEFAKPDSCISGKYYTKFDNLDNLVDYVENLSWDRYTGVLLSKVGDDGFLQCYKFTPEEYLEKREIRGSEPNFRLRYLELKSVNREQEFRDLFPERNEYFDQVDNDEKSVTGFLKDLYHERYIRKQFTVLPKHVHYILDSTYRSYDVERSIVQNIKQTLKHGTPHQINGCIKHMYLVRKREEMDAQ